MFTTIIIILLISNALTMRRAKSILYSRLVIIWLISTSFLAWNNLFINSLEKGLGIYSDLFLITTFVMSLTLYTLIITGATTIFIVFFRKYKSILLLKVFLAGTIVFVLFKAPFLLGFKLLNSNYLIPVLSALSACMIDIIKTCLDPRTSSKHWENFRIFRLFIFSLVISYTIFIAPSIFRVFDDIYLLEWIHSNLLIWLKLDFVYIKELISPIISLIAWEVVNLMPILDPISGKINLFSTGNSGYTSEPRTPGLSMQLATLSHSITSQLTSLNTLNLSYEDCFEKAKHYEQIGDSVNASNYKALARRDMETLNNTFTQVRSQIDQRSELAEYAQRLHPASNFRRFSDIRPSQLLILNISHTYLTSPVWRL